MRARARSHAASPSWTSTALKTNCNLGEIDPNAYLPNSGTQTELEHAGNGMELRIASQSWSGGQPAPSSAGSYRFVR
jgi:hypothetical protein